MGKSEAGLGYYSGLQTGARREETLRGQEGAGAYFRISVMVSFRSFPWKGREPVSISNCRRQGSIQALVPISHAPHLFPHKPLSSIPRILAGLLEVHLCLSLSPLSVKTPGAALGTRSWGEAQPSPGWGTQAEDKTGILLRKGTAAG